MGSSVHSETTREGKVSTIVYKIQDMRTGLLSLWLYAGFTWGRGASTLCEEQGDQEIDMPLLR